MSSKRVLSIGQCSADHGAITRTFRQYWGAEVVPADTADDALAELRSGTFDLVLVNRILDADATAGVELIRRLKATEGLADVPIMLVSNYEEAQREAVEAGALPGFGKAGLGQPDMIGRVGGLLDQRTMVR
jgi:two-component system chemotaxis response regulator CheY